MIEFTKLIQAQFDKMCATGKLFRSSLTGHQVWDLYINSFTKEQNPIFRDPNSTTHNCNLCNNFIRRYGNIVAIDADGKTMSLFDVGECGEYTKIASVLSEYLQIAPISDVFFETFDELNSLPYESCDKNMSVFKLGIGKNVKRYTREEAELYGVVKPNEIRTFSHFHLDLPKQFVDKSGKSLEQITAFYRDKYFVFKRAMKEISLDTLYLVKDLINQGSLLDGETHLHVIQEYITFHSFKPIVRIDNWYWVMSYDMDERIAKFKNTLIGILCTELAEGLEINKACENWNKRVDPINYMKATAPITKKQIEDAKKFVEENGYEESFNRRFATIDDIKASEILHVNTGNGELKAVSIFDNVKSTSTRHKRSEFDKIEEVTIEKFMSDILPNCTSVEAFLTNQHEGNLVSLTTANIKESKPIFKWNNNYSWTFNGNIAGKSMIKDAVKSRGGKTNAIVRVTLFFPGTTNDYDLHLIEPNKRVINYQNLRVEHASTGKLDLDAQGIDGHQPPERRVENITYSDKSRMPEGSYEILVNNYSRSGLHTKFQLEVEIEGDVTLVELKQTNPSLNRLNVGKLVKKGNEITFHPENVEIVSSQTTSKEVYNLNTNQFHKVNLICLSPNHWGDNNIGNKHYLFMLEGCKCPTSIRSFHAENLLPKLAQHRKVLEVLGNTTMIEPSEKQLSGLGFNATVRDELIVKLQGSFKRIVKIKF